MSAVSSTAVLAAGIFASESGQRLLHILLALGERGFRGLYDKCATNLAGDYYQEGLRRVRAWSKEVLQEDIDFVRRQCPDLEETYEQCFVQHVADRYRGRHRPTTRAPPLLDFIRRFLESLGQHETLTTGDYFGRRDPMLKKMTCMDAARQALYASVTVESVRVELLSEAGGARAKSLAEASEADLRAAHPDATVHPDDSISQRGRPRRAPSEALSRHEPTPPPPAPRRAPSEAPSRHEPTPSEAPSRHEPTPPPPAPRHESPPAPRRAPSEAPSRHESPPPRTRRVAPPPLPPPSVHGDDDDETPTSPAAHEARPQNRHEFEMVARPAATASSRDSTVSLGPRRGAPRSP
jgi:hypothetical protein